MEYAMTKHADGSPVQRPAAMRSFQKFMEAVLRAGGRAPHDSTGTPMLWNQQRGWFPRGESKARRMGRPHAELQARQAHVARQIRQDRLDQEIRADHPLLRGASPIAWRYAKHYARGLSPQPGLDASLDVLTGWRLARRGFDSPPEWLLRERREAETR